MICTSINSLCILERHNSFEFELLGTVPRETWIYLIRESDREIFDPSWYALSRNKLFRLWVLLNGAQKVLNYFLLKRKWRDNGTGWEIYQIKAIQYLLESVVSKVSFLLNLLHLLESTVWRGLCKLCFLHLSTLQWEVQRAYSLDVVVHTWISLSNAKE